MILVGIGLAVPRMKMGLSSNKSSPQEPTLDWAYRR